MRLLGLMDIMGLMGGRASALSIFNSQFSIYLGLRVMKGMRISSMEMPPCWKVFI